MDRLLTMASFVKVVQYGSFTAASSDIGISRALVSRHIADLEGRLGVRLLNRTTRAVTTTEAGQQYYETCQRVLHEVRSGEEGVKNLNVDVQGNIAIIAPKWVGYLEVSTALLHFAKRYPKVNVQLTLGGVSTKTHDFLERGFDIAFQTKTIRDSIVKVKKIADISYVTVASPAYLKGAGIPRHPRDLKDHQCLMQTSEPIWRFMADNELVPVKVSPRFSSNSYAVLCVGAVNDLGVAIVPRRVAAQFLEEGQIQEVMTDFRLEDRPLFAAYAPGSNLPRKVRALLTFLGEWFRKHPLT
ncbi:MAG: LysR family transcriptional regulator [Azospirillaceae bacterium]|nr:LysR family transcriptional regulator [Azospirillaceae bacterium]